MITLTLCCINPINIPAIIDIMYVIIFHWIRMIEKLNRYTISMTFCKIVNFICLAWKLKRQTIFLIGTWINGLPKKRTIFWDGITYQTLGTCSAECGSSPNKMKHESQVGYADILVLFFLERAHYGLKMGNTRIVIYFYSTYLASNTANIPWTEYHCHAIYRS